MAKPINVNKKALVEAAREKRPDKKNYTFRLDSALYTLFESQCEKDKVKPTAIIEAFLAQYTKQ